MEMTARRGFLAAIFLLAVAATCRGQLQDSLYDLRADPPLRETTFPPIVNPLTELLLHTTQDDSVIFAFEFVQEIRSVHIECDSQKDQEEKQFYIQMKEMSRYYQDTESQLAKPELSSVPGLRQDIEGNFDMIFRDLYSARAENLEKLQVSCNRRIQEIYKEKMMEAKEYARLLFLSDPAHYTEFIININSFYRMTVNVLYECIALYEQFSGHSRMMVFDSNEMCYGTEFHILLEFIDRFLLECQIMTTEITRNEVGSGETPSSSFEIDQVALDREFSPDGGYRDDDMETEVVQFTITGGQDTSDATPPTTPIKEVTKTRPSTPNPTSEFTITIPAQPTSDAPPPTTPIKEATGTRPPKFNPTSESTPTISAQPTTSKTTGTTPPPPSQKPTAPQTDTEGTPVTTGTRPPQVTTGTRPPQVTTGTRPPQVTTGTRPPQVTTGTRPPPITTNSERTDIPTHPSKFTDVPTTPPDTTDTPSTESATSTTPTPPEWLDDAIDEVLNDGRSQKKTETEEDEVQHHHSHEEVEFHSDGDTDDTEADDESSDPSDGSRPGHHHPGDGDHGNRPGHHGDGDHGNKPGHHGEGGHGHGHHQEVVIDPPDPSIDSQDTKSNDIEILLTYLFVGVGGVLVLLCCVLIVIIVIVRHKKAQAKDAALLSEEEKIAVMKQSGYVNPTYKFFDQATVS